MSDGNYNDEPTGICPECYGDCYGYNTYCCESCQEQAEEEERSP